MKTLIEQTLKQIEEAKKMKYHRDSKCKHDINSTCYRCQYPWVMTQDLWYYEGLIDRCR